MKRGLFLLLLLSTLVGCGYKLQMKADLPFESIAIGDIKNLTYEPRLKERFISALTEALGSYGFSISKDARFRIEGEINGFNMRVLSEKSLTASEYEVDISVAFRVIDAEKGQVYPVKILKPFSTHFTTRERLSEVIAQKDQYTKEALAEIAHEIARYLIYDLPAYNATRQ